MANSNWTSLEPIEEKQETTLFDLPAEDILMTHVAQYLEMEDLKNLRLCSRKCKDLADIMFAGIRTSFVSHVYQRKIEMFLMKTRRLRSLVITSQNISNETVHYVLNNNYLLNTVVIVNHLKKSPHITTWGLMPLAKYCKNILILRLDCVPITDEFLQVLSRHRLILVHFDVNKNDKDRESPSQAALQAFFEKQLTIEDVLLKHFTIDLSPIVSAIANFCPNLEDLNIENSVLSDDKVLIELPDKCPKLTHLNIIGVTPAVTGGVLKEFRRNKKYQHIELRECDSSLEYSTDEFDETDEEDSLDDDFIDNVSLGSNNSSDNEWIFRGMLWSFDAINFIFKVELK